MSPLPLSRGRGQIGRTLPDLNPGALSDDRAPAGRTVSREGDSPRLTDSTENLVRFIASPDGEKLFYTKEHTDDGYEVLERVK